VTTIGPEEGNYSRIAGRLTYKRIVMRAMARGQPACPFIPWRWMYYVFLVQWFLFMRLHTAVTESTTIRILVRNWIRLNLYGGTNIS
jgi:hypothetical protein